MPNAAQRLRKRSKRPLSAHLKTYWVLGVLVFVALAGAASWFVRAPYFCLKSLAIVGLARVPSSEVRAHAALDPRANVWLLDTGATARRIEAIPYVATAWIHRRFPAGVRIVVAERTPTACVRDSEHRVFTLDDALRTLERGCAMPAGPLYVIRTPLAVVPGTFLHEPELLHLQSAAHTLEAAGKHYRAFREDEYGGLVATLQDGITIRFGDSGDLVREQGLISPILATLGPKAAAVAGVDLRAPTTPVVRYRAAPHPKSTPLR